VKTKQQEIELLQDKLETNDQIKAKNQKELDEQLKTNKELQREIERLQAVKAEKARIAQEQANNAVVASEQVSAPVSNIEQIIRDAAVKHGLDPNWFVNLARCESGLNPNAINYGYYENGNPSGLFQHISGYWAGRASAHGYPGASVFDPVANANVTASMWKTGSHLWECQ
jgi:soluble lytic murein transglycosylase-like protein